jgi:hypothetical protein
MKGHLIVIGAVGAVAAALTWTTASRAQEETVVAQPPSATVTAPAAETPETYSGPNRSLIGTGLVTFGLAYIPAVVVASQSPQSPDHHMYVPVAGPWMNLANRPACGAEAIACDTETTNKVLIGVDGVFQGIGALTTIVGFFSPEREHEVVTTSKPSVHITPARMGAGGYGLAAFGNF